MGLSADSVGVKAEEVATVSKVADDENASGDPEDPGSEKRSCSADEPSLEDRWPSDGTICRGNKECSLEGEGESVSIASAPSCCWTEDATPAAKVPDELAVVTECCADECECCCWPSRARGSSDCGDEWDDDGVGDEDEDSCPLKSVRSLSSEMRGGCSTNDMISRLHIRKKATLDTSSIHVCIVFTHVICIFFK